MPDDRTKVDERHRIEVSMNENTSELTLLHTIMNIGEYDIKLAPWCMTVAEKGGVEIIPQCKKNTGLLSNRRVVFWPYSNVQDERFYMSDRYITLAQTDDERSFKVGVNNEDGWSAYVNKGSVFIKRFDFDLQGEYPDFSVNYETFTNGDIIEIETLGTLEVLKPGEFTQHEERWELTKCDEAFDRRNDESIDSFVIKYIRNF